MSGQSLKLSYVPDTLLHPSHFSNHLNLIQSPWRCRHHGPPRRWNKPIILYHIITYKNITGRKILSTKLSTSHPVTMTKKKVKWSRYRPGVAQRVGRGIALLFHDRGTRSGWVVISTPRPHFTPRKEPVPILQEAGCAPGPVWMGRKSHTHRDLIPDCPACSQSLYRLNYLTHPVTMILELIWSQLNLSKSTTQQIANKSSSYMKTFKYLRTSTTNQYNMHDEINSILHSWRLLYF